MSQHADGFWTEDFLYYLDLSKDDIIQVITKQIKDKVSSKGQQIIIVLTWIALKILTDKYDEHKNEWKLIAAKGKKFLQWNGFKFEDLSFPSLDMMIARI